ncbi:hypothetical protein HOC99_03545 [Candidatus Woesearchaeota archaeon]|nr:hypothetical protein [Candidatus Woesearchaeota archaeon]MBT4387653.1 hypothetical protein [Candidatus Woesearchaeota archaeon]MBT4595984.1 hypothetical protein [Candidatus Woesearchaeota archaeon]MBT7849844.1 hypothetical protein [Candidatus Woesearchaeota archaeon]MBT7962726.1 hypothetical protein [Candidatus Woesearchaeota archaeon]
MVLIFFLAVNAFLAIDILKEFSVKLDVDNTIISKIYENNKAIEIISKLKINKNKDIYTDTINFINIENAEAIYSDGTISKIKISLRNNYIFLNNQETVNLRLLLIGIDNNKQIEGIRFKLLSSVNTYYDQISNDNNILYINLEELNNEFEKNKNDLSFKIKNLLNNNQLIELAQLNSQGNILGYSSLFSNNIIYYISDDILYLINLKTGDINEVKSLDSIFSNNIKQNKINDNIMTNYNNELFIISDLGFISKYNPTSNTILKFSNNIIKPVSNSRNILSYDNNIISNFDEILIINEILHDASNNRGNEYRIIFENEILDMYEYEDTLYIIEDSNNNNIHIINLKQLLSKLKHSDKNIHEIKQFNKIDEIIKLNIDGISHIDAENVYANQNNKILKFNKNFEEGQKENYLHIKNNIKIFQNRIEFNDINKDIDVKKLISNDNGAFIIDNNNKLFFLKNE